MGVARFEASLGKKSYPDPISTSQLSMEAEVVGCDLRPALAGQKHKTLPKNNKQKG
jgi:hypothetical protein